MTSRTAKALEGKRAKKVTRWREWLARRYVNEKRAEYGFWNSLIRIREPEWIEEARKRYKLPDTWRP